MCESVYIPYMDHVPRRPSALQVHRTLDFERAGVEGRGAETREDSVVSGEREGSDLLLGGGLARGGCSPGHTVLTAAAPVLPGVCLDPTLDAPPT